MKNIEETSNQNHIIRSPIPENPQSPNTAPRALIPPSNASPSMGGFVNSCVISINESESIANTHAFQASPQKRKKSDDRCFSENRNPQSPNLAPRSSYYPCEHSPMSELGRSGIAVASNVCQPPPFKRQRIDDPLPQDRDLPEDAQSRMHGIVTDKERHPNQKLLDKMEVDSVSESEYADDPSETPTADPYALSNMPFDLLLTIRSFLDPKSNHALDQTCKYLKDASDPHHYARSRFLQRQPLIISLQELRAQGEHFTFNARFALTISENDYVTDEELQSIVERFPYITELSLQGQISNEGLKHISQLQNLTTLELSSCTQITDDGIQHLTNLKNLTTIKLSFCSEITDVSLPYLSKFENLTTLDLSGCDQITDEGFGYLKQLRNLIHLDLSECAQITDEGLGHLRQLRNLVHLDLSECAQITDDGLRHLRQLRNLIHLNLTGCDQITDDGLQHLAKLHKLTKLSLSSCDQITDDGLQHLIQLKDLIKLNLSNCDQITDDGLQHLTQLQNLIKLDLSNCDQITDAGIQHLTQLQNLIKFDLFGCGQITDVGLLYFSQFQNLTKLDLSGCHQITDMGLQHLTQLHNLTSLYLNDCPEITDVGLQLLSQLQQLTRLYLTGCDQVTEAGLQHLNHLHNYIDLTIGAFLNSRMMEFV